ncbi:MAG: universal stress protein [Bryobacterales bacterium]
MASLRRVVLATDLAGGHLEPFAHALALAVRAGRSDATELVLVHLLDELDPAASWRRLPAVRTLLARWGTIPADAPPEALDALGISVQTVDAAAVDGDLPTAIARRVAELSPDLVILGTGARTGWDRILAPSVAEPVAREVHRPTLFVAEHARGLVDVQTGALKVGRVLVPITEELSQQPLIDELVRLLGAVGAADVAFTFVHVGDGPLPTLSLPPRSDWRWRTDQRDGAVVEQILQAAVENEVDLIAMATHGHDSLLDQIRGSHTERVLRRAPCPLLAVPVD